MNERVMNITICSVDVPKKVEFREFFRANQHRKSTADPQLMSQNFPKFSYPYGGLLKILPKFRKVLRKFQQQINRAITELDFFWDINTANGDIRNQSIIKQLIKQVIKSCLLLRICMNNIY